LNKESPEQAVELIISEIGKKLHITKEQCRKDLEKAGVIKGEGGKEKTDVGKGKDNQELNPQATSSVPSPVVVMFALILDEKRDEMLSKLKTSETIHSEVVENEIVDKPFNFGFDSYALNEDDEDSTEIITNSEIDDQMEAEDDYYDKEKDLNREEESICLVVHLISSKILNESGYEWKYRQFYPSKNSSHQSRQPNISVFFITCRKKIGKMERKEINVGELLRSAEISIELFQKDDDFSPGLSSLKQSSSLLSHKHQYCLDFKRIRGGTIPFMAMCSMLLHRLVMDFDNGI
jgi:hypothetical protein